MKVGFLRFLFPSDFLILLASIPLGISLDRPTFIPMNEIEMLQQQTENAYAWVHKLLDEIPREKWAEVPPVLETNVNWQIGHLLMSYYFTSIMVIVGHRREVGEAMPLRDYGGYFTTAPAKDSVGKVESSVLLEHLRAVEKASLEVIQSQTVADLGSELHPTRVPHPFAKTKYEALDWNIKHVMWHCGQLSLLKRVLGTRYDFGLEYPQK